jgi:hypothetical protein
MAGQTSIVGGDASSDKLNKSVEMGAEMRVSLLLFFDFSPDSDFFDPFDPFVFFPFLFFFPLEGVRAGTKSFP